MPDITNPEAVRVANQKIRPLADAFGQLYFLCKQMQAEYVAQDWASLFPDTADVVVDGSATDGRNQILSSDVRRVIDRTSEFITNLEATSSTKLNQILTVAVNPER